MVYCTVCSLHRIHRIFLVPRHHPPDTLQFYSYSPLRTMSWLIFAISVRTQNCDYSIHLLSTFIMPPSHSTDCTEPCTHVPIRERISDNIMLYMSLHLLYIRIAWLPWERACKGNQSLTHAVDVITTTDRRLRKRKFRFKTQVYVRHNSGMPAPSPVCVR